MKHKPGRGEADIKIAFRRQRSVAKTPVKKTSRYMLKGYIYPLKLVCPCQNELAFSPV